MQTKNKNFVKAHAPGKKGSNRIMCSVHGQEYDLHWSSKGNKFQCLVLLENLESQYNCINVWHYVEHILI